MYRDCPEPGSASARIFLDVDRPTVPRPQGVASSAATDTVRRLEQSPCRTSCRGDEPEPVTPLAGQKPTIRRPVTAIRVNPDATRRRPPVVLIFRNHI